MHSPRGLTKATLLQLITKPISGKTLNKLRQAHGAILGSKGAMMYAMEAQRQHSRQGESLTTEKLAYAIPANRILAEDPLLLAVCRYTSEQLGLSLFSSLYWMETPSLQLRFPLPMRTMNFNRWWIASGPKHYKEADQVLLEVTKSNLYQPTPRFAEKPFGVNLIGHASCVFGLGEYLRMVAKALEAADIPFVVIDIPANNGAPTNEELLRLKTLTSSDERPYAFSIYCMTADTHLQLEMKLAMQGETGSQTYSVAIWFWELDQWPKRLARALVLADEYWPCTELIHRAMQGAKDEILHSFPTSSLDKQILTMPPVVELGRHISVSNLEERKKTRRSWGLDPDAVLFAFSFDLNSRIARKNPQAVIEAFQLAFSNTSENIPPTGLVIKTFPPRRPEPLWEEIKTLSANDKRITIIENDLDRSNILSLYGCCDCFVSLHRSEGLGLGMAEAFQLGLDVIATDYGGNVDFCTGPLAHPVPYHLVPVEAGEYPDHEDMMWADPDVKQAAELMLTVARKRSEQPITNPDVVCSYRSRFSAKSVGNAMRLRFEELWQNRMKIQKQMPGNPFTPTSANRKG
jgi:glycosyltransferase involved in cell wall biosynthesis